ncbi:MAG TPA: HD domain-containing protein, partial [Gaiellaceae bacterium]|nr:HD domain-containing protein [Gaiellaceae bacterium]
MTTLEAGERHEELLEGLLAELAAQRADVDVELVTRAFRFAAAAHEGQQRRSGEPFITHPVGVATICAGLRLDEQTIAAALLHDVVEDTGVELD